MPTKQELLEFIRDNPGTETKTLTAVFKMKTGCAAARCSTLLNQKCLTRELVRTQLNGAPVYGYYYAGAGVTRKPGRKAAIHRESERVTAKSNPLDSLIDQIGRSLAEQIIGRVSR